MTEIVDLIEEAIVDQKETAIEMIEIEVIVMKDLTGLIEIEEILIDLIVIIKTEVTTEVVLQGMTVIEIKIVIATVKVLMLLFVKVLLKEVDMEVDLVDREEVMIRLHSLLWLRDQCSNTNRRADLFNSQLTT